MKVNKILFITIFFFLTSCVGSSTTGVFGTGVSIALDPRTIGTQIDLTDNHLEPRKGIRFEILHNATNYIDSELSDYDVNSMNLTTYIPFLGSDTLLINAFQSRSVISDIGLTEESRLSDKLGIGCNLEIKAEACNEVEKKRINYPVKNLFNSKE